MLFDSRYAIASPRCNSNADQASDVPLLPIVRPHLRGPSYLRDFVFTSSFATQNSPRSLRPPPRPLRLKSARLKSAFTLLELLVVVAIIALLIAVLVPTLARAKERALSARCLANLQGLGRGLVTYQESNDGYVVPSYNMTHPGAFAAAAGDVIDGWATILDHNGFVPGWKSPTNNLFFCPNTLNLRGMDGGQTLYDQDKPNGYQDWPVLFTSAGGDGATKSDPASLPIPGFGDGNGLYQHQIRCGYFLNAYNPIGTAPASTATVPPPSAYTQSVGFGPFSNGNLPLVKATSYARPQALIVACDGMYMGRQSVTRLGEQNRRVGYRHPGPAQTHTVNGTPTYFDKTISNAVFADAHAEPIQNPDFPHANILSENLGPYSLLPNQ